MWLALSTKDKQRNVLGVFTSQEAAEAAKDRMRADRTFSSEEYALPEGLAVHCDVCGIVIPSDAPSAPNADCKSIADSRLAWFNPNALPKAQHAMAAAAWTLIYHRALNVDDVVTAYASAVAQVYR